MMAKKRHIRAVVPYLMALALVFPPLTSTLADSLGLDLAHHHCAEHGVEKRAEHGMETLADHDVDPGDRAAAHDHANTGDHDPFQCDQCHFAFAALPADLYAASSALVGLPSAGDMVRLRSADPPLSFKPPIA